MHAEQPFFARKLTARRNCNFLSYKCRYGTVRRLHQIVKTGSGMDSDGHPVAAANHCKNLELANFIKRSSA